MNIHVGDMVYYIKIPMFLKILGYGGASIGAAIATTDSWNPYNWAWPDWFKWGMVISIQILVFYRAYKNRNKR